jgi:intein-encoded DNA endonuclease-like protein
VGSRKGVKLRPTTERDKLRTLVLDLRKEGLSYNKIIAKISAEHGVALRKSHISRWVNSKHHPFGSVRLFDPIPSPELAYVVGVRLGDASMSVNRNHNYMIKLRVIDREFAQEFSRCLSVILRRDPPRVKWREDTHSWHTELSSVLLQNFLRRPLGELKQTIEHDDECVAAFIRGFFDSEGWVYKSQLGVVNTNKELLLYVSQLLKSRFDISVGPPRVTSKGGRIVLIKGKFYTANKDCYNVPVYGASLVRYKESVGFTIIHKQERLLAAIDRFGA